MLVCRSVCVNSILTFHYYVVFCPFLSQIVSIPPPVVLVVVPINIDCTSNMLLELLIFNVCQF